MNGDDDYDLYGDTDQHNVPDGGLGQNTSAGDGLPGYPVDGHPGWRAGVFTSGKNLLGLIKVSNPVRDGASMPPAYMPDGHGGVQLRPDFAATHPQGPLDFGGMAREIHWPGVAVDLGKIGVGVAMGVAPTFFGAGANPNPWLTGGSLAWRGAQTLHNQRKANPKKADPVMKPNVDEASNGLP